MLLERLQLGVIRAYHAIALRVYDYSTRVGFTNIIGPVVMPRVRADDHAWINPNECTVFLCRSLKLTTPRLVKRLK